MPDVLSALADVPPWDGVGGDAVILVGIIAGVIALVLVVRWLIRRGKTK